MVIPFIKAFLKVLFNCIVRQERGGYMLREARSRAHFEKSGAMRIRVPKDLVQSLVFPFKKEAQEGEPFDLLVKAEDDKIVLERYRQES